MLFEDPQTPQVLTKPHNIQKWEPCLLYLLKSEVRFAPISKSLITGGDGRGCIIVLKNNKLEVIYSVRLQWRVKINTDEESCVYF